MRGSAAAQKHTFYLAPLRGVTDRVFRAAYEEHFGRFDYMLAPFVPTIRGERVRDYHIRDLLPDGGGGTARLIPQIIGNDGAGFLLLCRKFADMGFASANWNLGCPAPLITRKKRGCGLLPYPDAIKTFLDSVAPKLPLPLSIKTRLGLDSKDELEALIPILNDYPLKELIIHPRTGSQLYGGTVDTDKFEACLRKSTHPVVYNGDICSADDFKYLSGRFPNVRRWMVGRGVVKNPYLLNILKAAAGAPPDSGEPSLRDFLSGLIDADKSRPAKALGRMKEIWRYLGATIDPTGALTQKIIRCESIEEYRDAADCRLADFQREY